MFNLCRHYTQSAHVGALYPAFLSMMIASGAPPALAALTLAFNTNLFGGLTHYASGQSAVYFSSGRVLPLYRYSHGRHVGYHAPYSLVPPRNLRDTIESSQRCDPLGPALSLLVVVTASLCTHRTARFISQT